MRPQIRNLILIAILLVLIAGSSKIAGFVIEYNWWKEAGQVETWMSMLFYQIAPAAIGALLVFIVLWLAYLRGVQFAGLRLRDVGISGRLVPVTLLLLAILFASSAIDYWIVMSYAGSRRIALPPDAWRDQVFSRTLPFYLFDLPFYSELLT